MDKDTELEVLSKINDLIKDLDQEAKMRVLTWVVSKYDLKNTSPETNPAKVITIEGGNPNAEESMGGNGVPQFESAAEMVSKSNTKVGLERALIVASFLQRKNNKDVTALEINGELRNMGYAIGNITEALQSLIDKRPQLIIQTRKSGTTKQAKKLYKVTDEGFNRVKALVENT